jgi:HAD superfamily hydrolase (TIGR01549 family)
MSTDGNFPAHQICRLGATNQSFVMAISVVCFDVGETLINETRLWNGWAAYLGVPAYEFRSALLDVIAGGEHHRKVFERFRPGFDLVSARKERASHGEIDRFDARDVYPDALPCLRRLRALGYIVGIAGNQPREAHQALKEASFEVDFIGSSTDWGVEKPSLAFFAKITEIARVPASSIAYVGDRLDNDVLPAIHVGMAAVFIKRGPWGAIHATRPEIDRATAVIDSLEQLPDALDGVQNI